MRCNLVGTLLATLCLMPCVAAVPTATPAGTVLGMTGLCTSHDRVLKRGDAMRVSDTLEVSAGGNLKLQMADGSVISVAPGSSVVFATYNLEGASRHAKLSLARGLLRSLVTPVRGLSTFEVSTAGGTASMRSGSGDWFIEAGAGSVQVGVLAGTVNLTSAATGQSVSIPARWGTRMETGRDPMLPRVWGQMEFNAVIRLTECCRSVEVKTEPAHSPAP